MRDRPSTRVLPKTEWLITKLPDRSNPVKLTMTIDTNAIGVLTIIENGLRYIGIKLERVTEEEAA